MAQINTTFGFKDQITQGLTLLNNTLTTLNNNLSAMKGQAVVAGNSLDQLGNKAENTGKKSNSLLEKLLTIDTATRVFNTVKGAVDSLGRSIDECSQLYNFQFEQETKLETVMRNHMKANEEQIKSIKDLASAQQDIGIYGDEMQLAGIQELATYVDNVDTLKGLIPVMNSMLAQGVGTKATAGDMQSYATMIGKVMQGQVGGMSKRGYKFSEEEEEILKTGTEMQKLAVLQKAVIGNFGDMNAALAKTPQGRIMQLNNALGDTKEKIGKALVPYQQFFKISTMQWKMKWYELLIKALEKIQAHAKEVAIAIAAIGTAVAALGAIMLANSVKMAAAWVVANAPLALTIAAILAIIAAISILLAYSEKTFPVIGGVIGGIGEVAKEVGAQIKYWFGQAIEGVVNGFLSLKFKAVEIFSFLVDKLAGLLEKIAPVWDFVFKTDLQGWVKESRESLEAWKNSKKPDDFSLNWNDDRTPGGVVDAWKRGKRIGETAGAQKSAEFQRWLDEKLAFFNANEGAAAQMTEEDFKNMLSFTSSGAVEVSDKGLINIADDYKELLSKQAAERFNLKFAQVTPSVTFGDVNINNEKDGENIFEKFVGKMEEAASSYLGD